MVLKHPTILGSSGATSTTLLMLIVFLLWLSVTGRLSGMKQALTGVIKTSPVPATPLPLTSTTTVPGGYGPDDPGLLPTNPFGNSGIVVTPLPQVGKAHNG
jgi:hypothetical protein